MKFTFAKTTTVDTEAWSNSNDKLMQDLQELVSGTVAEDEIIAYLNDMTCALKPVEKDTCKGMLFLMYDAPSSMPSDARVEFVYRPTYLAATIMMTAMNRYERVAQNNDFRKTLSAILEATLGRSFAGAGYESTDGLMDTLEIFAMGDVAEFISRFPTMNESFVTQLQEALDYLKNKICTGEVKNAWSGEDTYSERGKKILAMYQNGTTAAAEYVWYACYGSNINKDRFMRYINDCRDTTPPTEERPFSFPYNVYFAKSSTKWHNGGVAFLDDSTQGNACGKIYKITKEQFEDVKRQEGPSYRKLLTFGTVEGLPVFSFTDMQKNEAIRTPADDYFTTILTGLKDCYYGIYSEDALTHYLINAIFPENTFHVARAVKENAHYISNVQISEKTGFSMDAVVAATKSLVEHEVIQQDQRSIRAGHTISDPDAFFFTVEGRCGRDLVTAMITAVSDSENEETETDVQGDTEGSRHLTLASRIERSSRNRLDAIRLHGYKCQVCGFDFEKTYGLLGRNYIEVHHVNPLAEQDGEHLVNPETDLVCLCANCHRMIHRRRNDVLTVADLKNLLAK